VTALSNPMTVLRPDVPEPPVAVATLAPRAVSGGRLVLIDNGKPKAGELLGFLAAELLGPLGLSGVEVVRKDAAGRPLEASEVETIAQRGDLVITGLGDCGSCSACSLYDAIAFERAGVPATVVITDAFVGHVARFAVQFGLPGYHHLVVPHPVSSRDDRQLRRMAADLATTAAAQLRDPS
jgi:hypothetical protein